MRKEYPVKQKDYERIIKDFKSIKFSCIRCGSKNIKVMDADSHPDGIKVHGVPPVSTSKDIGITFSVVGILICMKCNHRFHVKIFDQGMRNTNLYFDNSLQLKQFLRSNPSSYLLMELNLYFLEYFIEYYCSRSRSQLQKQLSNSIH